jgi:hypothetical protein
MPRPLRPPRGVFVTTQLIFDAELSDAVKTTGIQLRALAWGQDETPPISMHQLCVETGKSQATLYGHMRLLRLRGALRWRPAGPTEIIVTFEPGFWNSGNLESTGNPTAVNSAENPAKNDTFQLSKNLEKPVKGLKDQPLKPKPKNKPFQNSGNLENGQATGAGTNAIKDAYVRLLGYKPDSWAAGEAVAAKAIGEKYTVVQLEQAYQHYKNQPFWKDKKLNLRYLKQQMPEFFQNHKAPSKPPSAIRYVE